MAYTYSKIATYNVGSGGVPSISFINIPQDYKDLLIKVSARSTGTGGSGFDDYMNLRFNNDSGSNYGDKYLQGYAQATQSGGPATGRNKVLCGLGNGSSSTASTFAVNEIYIPNYTSSNYKPVSVDSGLENNNTSNYVIRLINSIWYSTAPVTSINLFLDGANFAQYTTAHLYGIKNEV